MNTRIPSSNAGDAALSKSYVPPVSGDKYPCDLHDESRAGVYRMQAQDIDESSAAQATLYYQSIPP